MKYQNVAEKNDAAKTIAGQLSNGTARRREGYSVYNKIYDFEANVKGRKAKMVMTSVSGHLLQLEFLTSYRSWQCVDPQSLFEAPIKKACGENYEPIKRTLEREIRSCQGLIIWTDCDREGENIGFEILEVCRAIKPNITVHRAIFSEITGAAVRRALDNLGAPDRRQSDAVDVRMELDLRTGAAITRFQTMRLQKLFPQNIADKLISYGSCQIPTLGFVVERYKEIEAFVSKPFWKIKVLHTIDDLTVEFLWARNRLFDKEACEDYYLLVVADPIAKVMSVTTKPKSKWRPQPLDTVELEKLGSRKLKMSAKQVMTVAEKLYTKGAISYPRTETNMFSKDINLRSLVEKQAEHGQWGEFAQRVLEWGPNPRNGNKSDQAHPPIHPTKLMTNLSGDEERVYELVCRHFLACVSKDALGSETIVNIEIAGEKFSATGLVILERNYLDVYVYDKWTAKQIHHYIEGSTFEPTEISMPEGATTAPPLLTEADLIALMEKNGIGTDATHAEHINTIKERGYIGVVDKGFLVPGVIGMGLYEGYDAMQLTLAKPVLRAEFESDLKKICSGQKNPGSVLSDQIHKYKEAYKQIMERITAMDEMMANRINERPVGRQHRPRSPPNGGGSGGGGNDDDDGGGGGGGGGGFPSTNHSSFDDRENSNRWQEIFKCPKCKVAHLALRRKKNQSGYFIGCLNYPDCRNAIWLADECQDVEVTPDICPKCGSGYKMLSMRFTNSYYKTLFQAVANTEGGSRYRTCLRCDQHFRNTFQINLNCVKSTGCIVDTNADHSAPIRPVATIGNTTSTNSNWTSAPKTKPSTKSGRSKQNEGKKENVKTMAKKPTKSNTKKSTASAKFKKDQTSAIATSNSNIRSFFSASRETEEAGAGHSDIVAAELENVPLEMLFDGDDDDFEGVNSRSSHGSHRPATTHSRNPDTVQSDFLHGDDDDDLLASLELGLSQEQPQRQVDRANSMFASSNRPESHAFNDSLSELYRTGDDDLEDYAWGSSSSRNRQTIQNRNIRPGPFEKTGQSPLPKRGRLDMAPSIAGNKEGFPWGSRQQQETMSSRTGDNNCDEDFTWGSRQETLNGRNQVNPTKTNEDYSWGSRQQASTTTRIEQQSNYNNNNEESSWGSRQNTSNTTTPNPRNSVKCSGCHQGAKELVVRKEGPNKGRIFYVCSKERPCKYFQWADELTEQSNSTQSANSRNAANDEAHPNCNCNEPARCLTVRKEGPNKGKEFYACFNRDKSCGFFQWADTEGETTQARNDDNNWGSGSGNVRTESTKTVEKKTTRGGRKCGLCRQEGHSRQKCPRKEEFPS